MSYFRTAAELGFPGCGSGCGCNQCQLGSYGESYVSGPFDGALAAPPVLNRRWQVGDPHHAWTGPKQEPAWPTVRQRYWKNEAARAVPGGEWKPQDIQRMQRGRAPLDPFTGRPYELEHLVPQRSNDPDRHRDLMPLTRLEHSFFDRYARTYDPAGRRFMTELYDKR